MINHYPRIFSLSTINIRQHQNCDYLIHKNRTDFSGDSGSGKSMVADMLQLILVGASEFKSSTTGTDIRDPKGMIIQEGRTQEFGYIFLNIEIRRNKYLVIGVYIESSHNNVKPFIIQSGYSWESLLPLSSPILYKDLISGEQIFPFKTLNDAFPEVVIKGFNWKEYHKVVYENGLLPLDLTNEKTLRSYASILRSFSRGKGFNLSSTSLKNFLFGDNEQTKLWQKYQDEVTSIQNDFVDHQRYLDESNLINAKQEQIKQVAELSDKFKLVNHAYLSGKCNYWYFQVKSLGEQQVLADTELNKVANAKALLELEESQLKVEQLIQLKLLNQDYNRLSNPALLSSDELKLVENTFIESTRQKKLVESIDSWLSEFELDLDTLQSSYLVERENWNKKESLQNFISHLERRELLADFNVSCWASEFEKHRAVFPQVIEELQGKQAFLQSISVFSDIQDPQSLAGWAIQNLEFPLSVEYESTLIYFQKFPRNKPDLNEANIYKRYIPFPSELFEEFKIKDSDDNGFWLNLDGVYEYIEKTRKPFFTTGDIDGALEGLLSLKSTTEIELEALNQQIISEIKLKQAIFDFANFDVIAPLYPYKSDYLNLVLPAYSELSPEEFTEAVKLYKNRKYVLQNHKEVQKEYSETFSDESLLETKLEQITKLKREISSCFRIDKQQLHEDKLEQLIQTLELEKVDSNKLSALTSKTSTEVGSILELVQRRNEISQQYKDAKLKSEEVAKQLSSASENKKIAFSDFYVEYSKDYKPSGQTVIDEDPDRAEEKSLLSQLQSAKIAFQQKFENVKESIDDSSQITGYSVGELAHRLLPTVFKSPNLDEKLININISERLDVLTESMREISTRKHEILARVINEVSEVYSRYLEKVADINRYLKRHTITGGNKASLICKSSADFPNTWISAFRKKIHDSLSLGPLFKDLDKEIDINAIMIKTFRDITGNAKADVSPEELLNPQSYFELEFNLKLESGKHNAGSNGQTYTANALLGLARLALIEQDASKGIKILPIDEAEGLGSNYDLLYELASSEGYQIISMSIETVGDIEKYDQNIYILSNNSIDEYSYIPPVGFFSGNNYVDDIEAYNQEVISQL